MERADTRVPILQKIQTVTGMIEVGLNESVPFHPKVLTILGMVGVNITEESMFIHLKILTVRGMIKVERIYKSIRAKIAKKDIHIHMRILLFQN